MIASLFGTASLATAPNAYAAPDNGCSDRFLTFPAWYRDVVDSSCRVNIEAVGGSSDTQLQRFIFLIVLNVIEIGMQLVAYISAGFIIYGGFKYLTAASDSNKIAGGRKTIQNALIGLVISFASIAIVNLVAGNIL